MIGDIINHLLADSNITAAVGTRIFPVQLNQDETLPAIMITINDVEANPTKTAASTDDFVELDLTTYAKSALEAFTIAELIRTRLDNSSGTMGSSTFQGIRFERLNMSHYPPDDIYTVVSEYRVHLRR